MDSKQIFTSIRVRDEDYQQLLRISKETKIKMVWLINFATDVLLEKYGMRRGENEKSE